MLRKANYNSNSNSLAVLVTGNSVNSIQQDKPHSGEVGGRKASLTLCFLKSADTSYTTTGYALNECYRKSPPNAVQNYTLHTKVWAYIIPLLLLLHCVTNTLISGKLEGGREQTVGCNTPSECGHQLKALGTRILDQSYTEWPGTADDGFFPGTLKKNNGRRRKRVRRIIQLRLSYKT